MNKFICSGNLVKDAEIKTATSGIKIARFTIAIKRKFKNEEGKYESDFLNCSAFRNSADYIEKYVGKGNRVNIVGRLENRVYEANGEKKYYTEVVVDEIECLNSKGNLEKEIDLKPITDINCPF